MFSSRYYLQSETAALMAEHAAGDIVCTAPDPAAVCHDKAVILPLCRTEGKVIRGGVCDGGFRQVAGYTRSRAHEHVPLDNHLEIRDAYVPAGVQECDEDVIFGGALYMHFGHFMYDSTCRLWYAASHPELKHRLAFCCYPPRKGAVSDMRPEDLPSFIGDFFELAGLEPERLLLVNEATRFRSVTVPHQDRCLYDAWYPQLLEGLLQAVSLRLPPVPAGPGRRVYLSRRHFERHDIFGEEYFEDFFARHGYEILCPEELPLRDQLAALRSADSIACTLGTLSHGALWARPGTALICLLRSGIIHPSYLVQQNICRIRGLDYVFVDVSANLLPARHDPGAMFIIGPTPSWKEFVRREFAEEVDADLYRHITAPGFGLEDYLRGYFRHDNVMENYWHAFDRTACLRSLHAAFMAESCDELERSLRTASRELFSGREYELLNARGQRVCTVRMQDDGRLCLVQGKLGIAAVRWQYDAPDQLLHWCSALQLPLVSFRLVSVVDPLGRFKYSDLMQPPLFMAGAAPHQLLLRALPSAMPGAPG